MKLSTITINFNHKHFPKLCVEALEASKTNFKFEIIFVDNGTRDPISKGFLEQAAKQGRIKLIKTAKNIGFSAGNNLGALNASGEYLLFLNPDTAVYPDALQKMVDYMEKYGGVEKSGVHGGKEAGAINCAEDSGMESSTIIYSEGSGAESSAITYADNSGAKNNKNLRGGRRDNSHEKNAKNRPIGILGPKLIYADGVVQDSCRRFPRLIDLIAKRTILGRLPFLRKRVREYMMGDFDHEKICEPDWITGAAMLIPKKLFKKVGGFDERYFLFMEDVDLCKKVRAAGYKIVYYPQAKINHYHQRLSAGGLHKLLTKKVFWHHVASMIKYFWKWRKG